MTRSKIRLAWPGRFRAAGVARTVLLLAAALAGPGCAAITNPIADGIPVNQLPEELRGKSRAGMVPIPFTSLRQPPNVVHHVGAGDVLGILVQDVLGKANEATPVHFPEPGASGAQPAIGYPIVVQDDGTISLPQLPPLKVAPAIGEKEFFPGPGQPMRKGLTLKEIQKLVFDAYTQEDPDTKDSILKPKFARITVTLFQARRYHILVFREDGGSAGVSTGPAIGASAVIGASHKGYAQVLDLPVGENDVLNALARTGGTPGTDAKNEVSIYKSALNKDGTFDKNKPEAEVIRIPLRHKPKEPLGFKADDVILDNGDIVYLEAREAENFQTAGLLGTGIYPLPRDEDLNVIDAICYIKAPLLNGGFGQAQFVANAINTGIGFESPSLVTILRKVASGRQLPIRVDLNMAIKDPRERILLQPGDVIVMQEKPGEAVLRYLSEKIQISAPVNFLRTPTTTGTIGVGPAP